MSVRKSVFLIFRQFGSNTVSTTNGGTQCSALFSETKSKSRKNCKLKDFGAGFEIAEGYRLRHS